MLQLVNSQHLQEAASLSSVTNHKVPLWPGSDSIFFILSLAVHYNVLAHAYVLLLLCRISEFEKSVLSKDLMVSLWA